MNDDNETEDDGLSRSVFGDDPDTEQRTEVTGQEPPTSDVLWSVVVLSTGEILHEGLCVVPLENENCLVQHSGYDDQSPEFLHPFFVVGHAGDQGLGFGVSFVKRVVRLH